MAVDVVVLMVMPMFVVLIVRRRRKGFVAQPALHLDALGLPGRTGRDRTGTPDRPRPAPPRMQRRAGLSAASRASSAGRAAGVGEVALGQQQPVGDRRLLDRLGLAVERAGAVDRVDRRHDAVEHVALGDDRVGHQRVQDRRRVGEAGGLDHDAGEIRGCGPWRGRRTDWSACRRCRRAPCSTGSRCSAARHPRSPSRPADGRGRSRRTR